MRALGLILSVAATLVAGVCWADIDPNSTGYESQSAYVDPYVTVVRDTVATASSPEASGSDTAEGKVASADDTEAQKKAEDAQKKCEEAQNKQAERDSAATQKAVDEACSPIDVAAEEPQSQMTARSAIGSDRSTGMYFPPENYKIKGKEISWALVESFEQKMAAAGYDDKAIAAVAGNLMHESNMFVNNKWVWDEATGTHKLTTTNGALSRGDKQNGVYTSFGIAQYHDNASGSVKRASDMLNFVDGDNLSPNGLQGTLNKQVDYLIADLPEQLKGSYAAFTDPNVSLEAKTGIIVEKYEIPAKVATEVYGRMGGADRLSNANSILAAMNSEVVYDTDSSNGTKSGGRPISNPGGTGSGDLIAAASANSGLGVTLNQLMNLGGLTGVSNGGTINFNSASIASALLANAVLQAGLGISPAAGDDTTKSSVTTTVTETVTESSKVKSYDVAKAIAEICADDLDESEDAKMLKVKICRTEAES